MNNRWSPIFFGEVKNERIVLESEEKKQQWKERLYLLEGQQIELTVQKKRKRRSTKQNSYYWGVILPIIGHEVGMIDEEVHDALRNKFLIEHGDKLDKIGSTTNLSTGEFVEYIMKIEMWAQEFLGINKFPDPNEYDPVRML